VRKFLSEHPTVRGFLIIALVALTIMVLNLYTALASLYVLARIAFFLAIAFFIYLWWRDRRGDIATWPRRSLIGFYGGAVVALTAVGVYVVFGASGMDAAAFLVILGLCAFSMFRVWRDQHTYG
jgi:hypothetical protein